MSLRHALKVCFGLPSFPQGNARPLCLAWLLLFLLVVPAAILSPVAHAQDFVVNSTVDRVDANKGDGKCDTGQTVSGHPGRVE